jgi:RNA polymerase sigma-70 factor (ECF subfamily)
MSNSGREREGEGVERTVFATTHWSVVMAATAKENPVDSEAATRALESLCTTYWYPIYVYVRRKGYGPEDAQDLTQDFFVQLLAKEHVRLADRNKGKFRTFLLAMLDGFLGREWSRAHRQKRGGQFAFISLDQFSPEQRYHLEPADHDTPEKLFTRQWVLTMLKHSLDRLEKECEADGKTALFKEARDLLSGEREGPTYATMSERLGMAEGTVRVAVHRLRQRYGDLLREEIAQTLDDPRGIDEELTCLMEALGGGERKFSM